MSSNETRPIITDSWRRLAYCPICQKQFPTSEYLQTVFSDDVGAEWYANMITHYRHQHRAYDRWIGYVSRKKGVPYENQKSMINEQSKRQILRKCKDYMRENNIGVAQVLRMQDNSQQTLAVLMKVFPGDKEIVTRHRNPVCVEFFGVKNPIDEYCTVCYVEDCDQRVASAY